MPLLPNNIQSLSRCNITLVYLGQEDPLYVAIEERSYLRGQRTNPEVRISRDDRHRTGFRANDDDDDGPTKNTYQPRLNARGGGETSFWERECMMIEVLRME